VIDLFIILALGILSSLAAKRIRIPSSAAQVIVGIIIGPPILAWVVPSHSIEILSKVGVVLLLGMAGINLKLSKLIQAGASGFLVAIFGIIFSFTGGYFFSVWWGSPREEALYVGTALTATSIGISVQVLHQFGFLNNKIGQVVIAAAVIDDITALYLLALAHEILTSGFSFTTVGFSIIGVAILLSVIFLLSFAVGKMTHHIALLKSHYCQILLAVFLVTGFGWITEFFGYSLVVGGFFSGLGLGTGMNKSDRTLVHNQLDRLVFLLAPFFFIGVGFQAEWNVLFDPGMPVLFLGLALVAIAGKTLGGVLGALNTKRASTKLLIGLSMVPRGEVALVIAGLGFSQGHLSHHVFITLLLLAITAAIVGPLLMTPLARRYEISIK
jgi:Kef-type K+ transport system membrane component KefB